MLSVEQKPGRSAWGSIPSGHPKGAGYMTTRINYVAVIVAAIVYFVWGGIWFTVFGGIWDTLTGVHGASATTYVVSFLLGFPLAYVIANVLSDSASGASAASGAILGAVIGLGIWATNLLGVDMFEQRPFTLWLIDAGYVVIGMAIVGAIIGGWRKRT